MSTKKPQHARTDTADVAAALRRAGLRRTASRIEVLRLIARSTAPMSHPDVMRALSSHGFDRVTVYRNLLDLVRVGLAKRSDHGDHVWRFELASTPAHGAEHPHFVCTDCGNVTCLTGVAVEISTTGSSAPRSVRTRKVAVQLSGRCNSCA